MPNDRMAGNKGEWSELYTLFRLLGEGRLYAANEYAERNDDVFYPLVKVFREEEPGDNVEYVINRETQSVDIVYRNHRYGTVSQETFREEASILLSEIRANKSSFEVDSVAQFSNGILIYKIKAPSSDKTDISMQIQDVYTNSRQNVGFSIKSEIGGLPTLLNASGATNFIYRIHGLTDDQIQKVNSIETKQKIIDRMNLMAAYGAVFEYVKMSNAVFEDNLTLVDSLMPNILAETLLCSFRENVMPLNTLVDLVQTANPLQFRQKNFYEYKLKKVLCAFALGLKPASSWDGHEEANGGYILVKESGDIVAYHIYNRDAFEQYLLDSTMLERPGTGRHGYMTIYKENGEAFIKLNLQIRFK